MKIRVMWIACVGIVLIVAGIGLPAIYAHWLETGSIVVLDMPLSLTALVFCGSGLLVFFITDQVNKHAPTHAKVAVSENPGYECYPSRRKRPLTTRISRLPSFGLLYAIMLGSVLMPSFVIFIYAWGYDHPAVGVVVHLIRPDAPKGDVTVPLIILQLEDGGTNSSPRLYLNSRPVAWEKLSDELKSHLKYHAEWVVYVEVIRVYLGETQWTRWISFAEQEPESSSLPRSQPLRTFAQRTDISTKAW